MSVTEVSKHTYLLSHFGAYSVAASQSSFTSKTINDGSVEQRSSWHCHCLYSCQVGAPARGLDEKSKTRSGALRKTITFLFPGAVGDLLDAGVASIQTARAEASVVPAAPPNPSLIIIVFHNNSVGSSSTGPPRPREQQRQRQSKNDVVVDDDYDDNEQTQPAVAVRQWQRQITARLVAVEPGSRRDVCPTGSGLPNEW
jgi:hypothetical protein